MVGHVLAKDEVGVRFSLSAHSEHYALSLNFPSDSPLETLKTVDNSGDNGDKRQQKVSFMA